MAAYIRNSLYNRNWSRSLSKGQLINMEYKAALKDSNEITTDKQYIRIVRSKSTELRNVDLESFMLTLDILTEHPAVSLSPSRQTGPKFGHDQFPLRHLQFVINSMPYSLKTLAASLSF